MRASFTLLLSVFCATALYSQDLSDSISVVHKKNSPVISPIGKKSIIERSRDLLPNSDSPLKTPVRMKRSKSPQPSAEMLNQPNYSAGSLVGTGGGVYDEIDPWGFAPNPRYLNRWFRDISGFRGFVDMGTTIGFGKDANHRIDWYGSFGYQFNPIFFLGVGQGYSISVNKEESSAPTFGNLRVNFLDENTTPYLDLKGGYSFIEGKGMFLNPNVGVSFAKKKRAWNVGVGYMFQKTEVKKYDKYEHSKYHGITLRVTFEFHILKL